MKLTKHIIVFAIPLLFLSCTKSSLEGTYEGQENAFFDKMIFSSDTIVELVFMGVTTEAKYELKVNRLKITHPDEGNQIFTILENGCLEGGGYLGTYCKD